MVRTDSARAKIAMACVVCLELIVPELRLPWRVCVVRTDCVSCGNVMVCVCVFSTDSVCVSCVMTCLQKMFDILLKMPLASYNYKRL